jgi:chromosome segregation ATPase
MSELDLSMMIALAVSVVAVALLLRVATEGKRTSQLKSELDELHREGRGRRKQQEQRDKALRRAEGEADKAARKLVQADKRVAQARETLKEEGMRKDERIRTLESELSGAQTEIERLGGEQARSQSQLEAAIAHVAKAEARATAAERAEAERPPVVDPAELSALLDRATTAESAAREHELATAAATLEAERLKSRVETQNTLYTSVRSELEVKKDQVRQQREDIERLQAYKVAFVDAPGREDTAPTTGDEESEGQEGP